MNPVTFKLSIELVEGDNLFCSLSNVAVENRLHFKISTGEIFFSQENDLSCSIRKNKPQLEKIIRSALKNDIKPGKIISCVFLEDFVFLKDADFNGFIRVDRRNEKLKIRHSRSGYKNVCILYADGSYNMDTNRSGYAGIVVVPNGEQQIYTQSFDGGSSNLTELLAVVDGLQRVKTETFIQVCTDSRFVIRGLAQWSHFWQHNNWQTAFGRDVRYAECWKEAYNLCAAKVIEFKWIKAHSGHGEHDFCHQLAKSCASR